MTDADNKIIKGYVLTDLIGVGGFGAVYRAHQPIVDREVAIKAILPEYANHPDFIHGFDTEAQTIAHLEHPHIVPLYDYWREPDGAYLVMRLLRGGNLHEKLAVDGPWSLQQASRFVDQITSALAVAHRRGIVHQDIKPGNILLDEDLNSYLADFGIAKNLLDYQDSAKKAPRVGTPLFMAPEQFNKRSLITPQTDIYSLGIVLYAVLTGRVPFTNTKTTEIIRSHLTDPLPPLQFVRPDIPHEINQILRHATDKDPQSRYESVLMMATDLRHAIPGMDTSTGPEVNLESRLQADLPANTATVILSANAPEVQNPYKGLQAFREADAQDFFGREALTERLLGRLKTGKNGHFLAVVGPSGSGKSSVVLAGVVPLLRQGYVSGTSRWYVIKMQPGSNPLEQVQAALNTVAIEQQADMDTILRQDTHGLNQIVQRILPKEDAELLLVIDQFEEVFTLLENEEDRVHFLNSLHEAVTAPDSRLHVIITLRADFYDRPLLYPLFGNMIREKTEVVLPLDTHELAQAIALPAERNGLDIDPALVQALIRDVDEQPGALPLLQYTLTDLFDRRQGLSLSFDAYEQAGGISGTLARRADELYNQLSTEQQQLARQIFLRLVAVSEGAEPTRQRVTWTALLSLTDEENRPTVRDILDLYGKNRLLTFDHDTSTREPTVEVAHEALIREWTRLQNWLEENRADLLTQRRLGAAITEWRNAGHDSSYLATGSRLAQFEAWQASTNLTLNEEETAYLQASITLRQRATLRLRLFISSLIVAVLIALGLAKFAFDQQAATARQAQISRSRELAATALTALNRLDQSLLLSLEALNSTETYEARNSLLTALQSTPNLITFLHGHTDSVRTVAFSPDGRQLVSSGRDGTLIRWDPVSHTPLGTPLSGHTGWVNSIAYSPDGQQIVSAGADQTIRLWDAGSGAAQGDPLVEHTGEVWDVAYSPDGTQLLSGGMDGVLLWDIDTSTAQPLIGPQKAVYTVAFSPDGTLLAAAGEDQVIWLWDATSGELLGDPLQSHTNWILDIAFSPNGRWMASAGVDTSIILWDMDTREALGQIPEAHAGWIRAVTFDPDSTQLATASTDGTIRLWDLITGERVRTLTGHQDAVWDVQFHPDGMRLASAGKEGAVVLWQPDQTSRIVQTAAHIAVTGSSLAFSPDGQRVAIAGGQVLGASDDATISLWALETPNAEPVTLTGHGEVVTATAFSSDGQQLASTSIDRTVRLWDLSTPDNTSTVLEGHLASVFSVAFSPDSQLVASGDDTGLIILWDSATGEVSGNPLPDHRDSISVLTFSPDGTLLASASRDGEVRLWNVATHDSIRVLEGGESAVNTLAFSADGALLAAGDRDYLVRVWDVHTGQITMPPLTRHTHWVLSAAFNPDGTILATGSRDGSIILWDVATGRMIASPLVGSDEGWIIALAFDAMGGTLLAGSTTDITRWDAGLATWRSDACALAGRNLTTEEWTRFLPDLPYAETCPDAGPVPTTEPTAE